MTEYREIVPSAAFVGSIEGFWRLRTDEIAHRVTPDGCADLLFSLGRPLQVVGAMTRYQDFAQPSGGVITGVRFRPGAWTSHFGISGGQITDRILPLEDLWGLRARAVEDRLNDAGSLEQWAGIIENSLRPVDEPTPVQRAIRWMERRRGIVSMDQLAGHCGLSPRQFRRLCLEQSGLSPKFLARVFRYRQAASRLAADSRWSAAELALDCGYYDQAHFINEFRQFSGRTPSAFTQ
jgi:AraC-like DNA-binding protein